MNNRTTILRAIRAATRSDETPNTQIAKEALALVSEPAAVQPGFDQASLLDRFVAKSTSERVTATVTQVCSMPDVPAAVLAYLDRIDQAQCISMQPCAELAALDWSGFDQEGNLEEDGGVAVTLAEYGIAETGSVVFRSGPDAPVLLNFLPLYHIVVLKAENMLAYTEDLWPHLGGPDTSQPRLLTIVTGTSGTADIEAKNVRGAHGPKNMHIVLVTDGLVA
jgi:L-lactate dehydrogenase complex protein LldG